MSDHVLLYRAEVLIALAERGDDVALDARDKAVIEMGWLFEASARGCARRIAADRAARLAKALQPS